MTAYFSSQTVRSRVAGAASTPRELARQLACNRREFLADRRRTGAGQRSAGIERHGSGGYRLARSEKLS